MSIPTQSPPDVSKAIQNALSERFLSRQELSERWGKSTKTLRAYERRNILTPLMFGPRAVRYRLSDIVAIENASEVR